MRCGIKSEIHSCTLELTKEFKELTTFYDFLLDLKEKREKVQYYLLEVIEIDKNDIKEFVEICELILNELNTQKINNIREKLNK